MKVALFGIVGFAVAVALLVLTAEGCRWSRRFQCIQYGNTAATCRANIP